jgi:nucleoside-diphosphate-sugar epimerase
MSDTKTVLVTGGAGFIGSHTVDRLVNKGYSVKILDDLSTGSLENISTHLSSGCAQFIRGDIRDYPVVRESLHGVDVVIHLAALTSVPFSVMHPQLTFDINVGGTLNLLRASVDEKIDKFILHQVVLYAGTPNFCPLMKRLTLIRYRPMRNLNSRRTLLLRFE